MSRPLAGGPPHDAFQPLVRDALAPDVSWHRRVEPGQGARVHFPAYPDLEAIGKLVRISPLMDDNERVLPVWVEVADPEHRLKDGMLATVTLQAKPGGEDTTPGVARLTPITPSSDTYGNTPLVPLAARGFVRRENVWPYILGANVTTLVDTLFAGALVGHPDSARMVALLMGSVAFLSLPVVFLFPDAFGRRLDRVASLATGSARAVVVFVALLLAIPLALVALL